VASRRDVPLPAKPLPPSRIQDQRCERSGPRIGVMRCDHHPFSRLLSRLGDSVAELAVGRDGRQDARKVRRHRLDCRQRQPLHARRQSEDVQRAEEAGDVLSQSQPKNAIAEAQMGGALAERPLLDTVTDDQQPRVGRAPQDGWQRVNQKSLLLEPDQVTHRHDRHVARIQPKGRTRLGPLRPDHGPKVIDSDGVVHQPRALDGYPQPFHDHLADVLGDAHDPVHRLARLEHVTEPEGAIERSPTHPVASDDRGFVR